MSRRPGSRRWGWAVLGSAAAHLVLLSALVQETRRTATRPDGGVGLATAIEVAAEPLLIDVAMIDSAAALPLPADPVQPRPQLGDAPQADRDRDVPTTVAPRMAQDHDHPHVRPAPDHGQAGGHLPAAAWRHDQSSLQARVTDGASVSQPSHEKTSRLASSPQAIRREATVGTGDAAHTRTPTRLPAAAQYAAPDQGANAEGAGTVEGTRAGVSTALDVPQVSATSTNDRGQGPLDAEAGRRSFDDERRGPAQDDRSVRAASAEHQPGIADFSRSAAPAQADSPTGRGPATAPGAVARPSAGTASSEYGAPNVQKLGPTVSERTQERTYDRYTQEIAGRVNRERIFPKALALRLEQGETIVFFVLRPDGKIRDGVRVVKSSGFDEFDSEAARAVLRAAPFPPMADQATARPLPVMLRVLFANPVVP
ncbi:MAG TPA: TonB family protein [Polyangia bacterium]|nr:TonB family protein [Polyangia bacterium]